MSAATLELRVLMGLQAGARMNLGDGRYVIGSGGSADILLSGPWIEEQHAALTVASGRATVAPLMGGVNDVDGAEITEEMDLVSGQAIDFDGVWITVGPPEAAWPDVSEVLARRVVAATSRATDSGPASEGAAPTAPRKASEPSAAASKRAPMPAGMLIPVAAAVFLLVVSGGWLVRSTMAEPPSKAAAVPAQPDPGAAASKAIDERLASLGMRDRLAARRSGSSWMVVGVVSDEGERDKVRAAFAQMHNVALRVHTEEEIAGVVAGLIARSGMPMKFELTGGRAKLTLAAPNVETAEQVAQSFREELGGARDIETEFLTPSGVIPSLQDLVNKAGLGPRIRLAPVGPASPHIAAQGALANAELDRWNAVLGEFARKHGDFVKVQSAITRLTPTMPFTVRAVLDGATPQVITADGHRILEGGSLRGYRLVAVRENELLFEGPERVSIVRPKVVEAPRAAAR